MPLTFLQGRSALFPLDSTVWDDPAIARFIPPGDLDGWRAQFRPPFLPEQRFKFLERTFRTDLENVRRLRDAGVRTPTGTDFGGLPAVQLEMEVLVLAGLTPLQAIRAATYDAASCLGVEDRLGSIERDKLADFILVDGDPATDIRALSNISLVVLKGKPFTREEILSSQMIRLEP